MKRLTRYEKNAQQISRGDAFIMCDFYGFKFLAYFILPIILYAIRHTSPRRYILYRMIQDNTVKQEIEDEWKGVRSFQSRIQAHLNASGGMGGVGATHQLRNISHNLTLLFAFSVLETTLKQLRDESVFNESRNGLKALMHSSQIHIPWRNFDLVDKAREDRNRVAHDQEILERGECWNIIDGIENELVSWNVVSTKIPFNH
ncbi:hypothetical protein [Candidatus Scalindua japonica]|nr:hypothetical protein [Candidatus Scalindua japonica]